MDSKKFNNYIRINNIIKNWIMRYELNIWINNRISYIKNLGPRLEI